MSTDTAARPNCALFYGPDGFRVDRKAVKGRRSAGAGFLKGLIEHGGVDRLVAVTASRQDFADFRALVGEVDKRGRPVVQAHPLDRRTCVVSDWNGYKDTVADGETGFRIPTATVGPGAGLDVADRHAAGVDSYDQMIGITSLATVVDVDACADALARLATDRELRARQGAAAMARARRLYDWRVVVAAYQDLWRELAELRAADPGLALRDRREAGRIEFPDPFAIYRHYPTALLGPDTISSRRRAPTRPRTWRGCARAD